MHGLILNLSLPFWQVQPDNISLRLVTSGTNLHPRPIGTVFPNLA